MIDIRPQELKIIKDILKYHLSECEVRVFGSRVHGGAKSYSDIDLVIVDREKVDIKTMFNIQEAFEESTLPFRVDMIDWHRISDEFKRVINNRYEVIQEK